MKFKVLLAAALIMVYFGLFLFSTMASLSYGQLFQPGTQQELSPNSTSPKAQQLKMPSPPGSISRNLHAVRITSPTRGQQIPIGKDLAVTGISLANSTSHCHVSVMVDGVKPYQRATPTGSHSGAAGAADYSKWKFVLTSKYTTLKQGPNNKIVAKYSCVDKPNSASFYSINIIGTTSIVTATKL